MPEFRIEKDSLGELKVPANAYYGIFTERARKNFKLTGQTTHPVLIKSYAIVKQAAAEANLKLGRLRPKIAKAIIRAAQEVQAGRFNNQFLIDMIQAGAGTPHHMNTNEVIANRAIEILGGEKGDYSLVNPNDQVNLGQSSNDVTPTAVRIACRFMLVDFIKELKLLEDVFAVKAKQFANIVKVGRTHLQDAVPIRLGQEFDAFREAVNRGRLRIEKAADELLELGLGGTAIGTGINSDKRYPDLAARTIARITGFKFYASKNLVYMCQSVAAFGALAAALKIYALEMVKIANDLMYMSGGPKAGLKEIDLIDVEPGSSIMPGKINPSIVEPYKMVCLQVSGLSDVVLSTVSEGNFQLNVSTPLIAYDFISGLTLFTNGTKMFRTICVSGIQANKKRIAELLDNSLVTATALTPYIGYLSTALLVKESLATDKPLKILALEKGLLEKSELDKILRPAALTEPVPTDKKLQQKIQARLKAKK
ncbi:MAG: aspartate ammonia-lyase [candidate division Zixibacteria bacterium]|nr:aspartate ammonia-lyase [candidate division Zixibacteria bacterium]MCI0595706.1 aspartate ammonia-lyase [candidate division Zixibacteria bacterium]